ncbi:aminotransferase class I/II-fold pyridoxal phosphate-dependent enzyme [Saccharibacillus qingshengii]|uniref:aminotransferase class I/II-fold pyridoxal phosphate-dependent enzyme n=1 Tax=Saccharibacillus qingshengii TaxID=1763540 RepID=UPI001C12F358
MEIRQIRREDNAAIETVIRESLIEFGGNREGLAWADPGLSDLYREYNAGGTQESSANRAYWVVLSEGRVIGGCGIAPYAGSGEVCELQKMYLYPEARGTGIARQLLRTALDFASRHYGQCYLETLSNMEAANRFYRKHGFRSLAAPLEGSEHFACDAWYTLDLVRPDPDTNPASPVRRSWRAQKLDAMGSSVFSEAARWREQAEQAGQTVINLGIGAPDEAPSSEIRQTLSLAVLRESAYTYPGTRGTSDFRRQCAAWMKHRFGAELDPDTEILPLLGSQDGLAHLAQAICNPGDLAILPDPGYPIYAGSLAVAGVEPWLMPLREENGFIPDLDAIPDRIWEQAVFILLNFPGNPVAALADFAFFERLTEKAKRWNVLIVHDLAYSEMGFDGYRPLSIFEVPGAKETAVELHSFSKSFNMAGCRVGYMAGNAEVVEALGELKGHIDFGVFEPIQEAAVFALEQAMKAPPGDRGVAPLYERRRDVFVEALAAEGWQVRSPGATMFLWARLPERMRCADSVWTSQEFSRQLMLREGIGSIPGSAFGAEGEGYIRFSLVQGEDALREAARRIGRFLRSLC